MVCARMGQTQEALNPISAPVPGDVPSPFSVALRS